MFLYILALENCVTCRRIFFVFHFRLNCLMLYAVSMFLPLSSSLFYVCPINLLHITLLHIDLMRTQLLEKLTVGCFKFPDFVVQCPTYLIRYLPECYSWKGPAICVENPLLVLVRCFYVQTQPIGLGLIKS